MSTSSGTTQEVDITNLSNDDRVIFQNEKVKMFKMTIVTCVLFGTIALISLLVFFFTSWGERIYNDMFAFFVTYIIGTITIILYLSNKIYNYKPKKSDLKIGYDAEMCPDYWNLKYINDDELIDKNNKSFVTHNTNKNHFKYKCEMNKDIFSPTEIKIADDKKTETLRKNYNIGDDDTLYINAANQDQTGINKDEIFADFKTHAANMNGFTYDDDNGSLDKNSEISLSDGNKTFGVNEIPMACDTVYPLYLSIMDNQNSIKNPSEPSNRFRCAYAKSCGVSWTEAGCT